ncbi:TPA: carbon-nitrogen hydrolase family protein [Candidatus Poribacteria bacterium]|nr:carbon-nitrogen hydrolase family protein [Candidatus Poribacteria bacterium]HIB89273.1 carbon-nitrogen hydrolase family protein [Candidatus Poribacteria bacterium]HIB99058.1 carbon-nitrogen hydrolase family protein [Candidatus Poribacteria bacterium]HIC19173.1 carbon-nitrogen hydrolase family protein [Candidatus Poribacteria bacterium]HIM12506.1 carbon-nitrogen hydrolase family protein [Candidatus Poribacteria bacterium]
MKRTRLLSISFPSGGYGSVEENRDQMVMYLEQAGKYQPDFVCFTEVARELGVPRNHQAWKGELIPGPTTEALGATARKYQTHVIVGMQERAGNRTFNAAVLIGRDGEVIGIYHKVQPTIGEMETGTISGIKAPTWETDRGQVGMCICFDLKFPEVAMMLAREGARMVFFPSMFHGGMRHGAWARDYGVFLVVSQSQESVIVDMCGRRLAWQGYQEPLVGKGDLLPFAFAEVNTNCKAYHLDFNQEKLGRVEAKYGSGVRFSILRPEATFVMESLMEDVSVEQIEDQFGLEDLWSYYDRARRVRGEQLYEHNTNSPSSN